MTRMGFALAVGLLGAGPALAQVHDGINNSPSDQAIADEFRGAGSKCDAPACHDDADGVYPASTQPGPGAQTPSVSAAQKQPNQR